MSDASSHPTSTAETVAALREALDHERAARRQAEQHLADLQQIQPGLDALPDLFWTKDIEGRYRVVNAAFCRFHGLTHAQVIGRAAEALFQAEKADSIRSGDATTLASGQIYRSEIPYPDATGVVRWIETTRNTIRAADGTPVGLIGVTRDVSDRVAAEADRLAIERALHEAQRHESLGLLTGGIAHDFNNLLTGILGHTELALLDSAMPSSGRGHLEQIASGARMAARLAGQLLAYAGKGQTHTQPIDLNQLTATMADLMRVSLPKAAHLHYDLAPNLPTLEGDLTQIQQVVLNLLTNAADALGGAGGDLLLRTGLDQLSAADLHTLDPTAAPAPGRYIRLEIQDSGCGMDQATIGRIFDPFFSTKGVGRGLGLAAVRGIVRSHRGQLHVQSVVGAGTIIRVWFPAIDAQPQPRPSNQPAVCAAHRPGSLLLIDDEQSVRQVTSRMIERIGYAVTTAPDGESGLALLADGLRPDLVLLDMTMPGMGGCATAQQIRLRYPSLPIVVMSGYQEAAASPAQSSQIIAAFIHKPFTLETLRSALANVISNPV